MKTVLFNELGQLGRGTLVGSLQEADQKAIKAMKKGHSFSTVCQGRQTLERISLEKAALQEHFKKEKDHDFLSKKMDIS